MFSENPHDEAFLYELARDKDTTALVGYLKQSKKPLIRRRAAEILGDLSDVSTYEKEDKVIKALIKTAQEDDDDSVRARAIDSLYRYGQESFDRLISQMGPIDAENTPDWVTSRSFHDWLEADYPEFRMIAATALGRIGNEEALPKLIEVLDDPHPRVRAQAARSCGLLGDERCVSSLVSRLEDPNPSVRQEAATALGTIGTKAALKALIPAARDEDESVRRIALDELGNLRNTDPVVVLTRALKTESSSLQRVAMLSLIQLFVEAPTDQSHEIRDTVAKQLAHLQIPAVAYQLIDIVNESQRMPVRRNAIWLLGQVVEATDDEIDEVYDCLIDALGDPDVQSAQLAAMSLSNLESDELERRLHILINDESTSDEVVKRARFVLKQIGRDLSKELITNAVDYKYVGDPADYTKQQNESDSE